VGKRDSSETRVVPVFNALFTADPSGCSWLPQLLALPKGRRADARTPPRVVGSVHAKHWFPNEMELPAPVSLLKWLVRNPPSGLGKRSKSWGTRKKRLALAKRDAATCAQALDLLSHTPVPKRAWYVLEGYTQPDVYLETDEVVVVIEGKRTESAPTRETRWMPVRHQIIRHLDCAFERSGGRQLFGFFIVSGGAAAHDTQLPHEWRSACRETITEHTLMGSLPHRDHAERETIAQSFLGATTWQSVCRELGVDWESLPDTV